MFRTTYPNKVFDYMAAARATVLVIDGVIREVIESSNGGVFVEPGNDELLAKTILELSKDPQRVKQMGTNARAYLVQHLNRRDKLDETLRFLQKLVRNEGFRHRCDRIYWLTLFPFLLKNGYEVRCLYRPSSDRSVLLREQPEIEWALGDVSNSSSIIRFHARDRCSGQHRLLGFGHADSILQRGTKAQGSNVRSSSARPPSSPN